MMVRTKALILTICSYLVICGCAPKPRVIPYFDVVPDASRVVFASYSGDATDVFELTLGTGQVRQVTSTGAWESGPSYSADGRLVAFSRSATFAGPSSLYIRDLENGQERRITHDNAVDDAAPCFVGGTLDIVFSRAARRDKYSFGGYRWYDWDLYLVTAGGTARRLTSLKSYSSLGPRCSDSEKRILIDVDELDRSYLQGSILDLQGAMTGRWTNDSDASHPDIDGAGRITYISDRAWEYRYEVYLGDIQRGDSNQLTSLNSYLMTPRIAARANRVLFLNDPGRNGVVSLWWVGLDGTGAEEIAAAGLLWRPEIYCRP